MFGISFPEIIVIVVVALIVVGPERLPKVARTLGHLWGRAHRYVNAVKSDIARDMAAEEFRALQRQVQEQADSMQQATKQFARMVESEAQGINKEVSGALRDPAPAVPPAPLAASTAPTHPTPSISSVEQPDLPSPDAQKKLFPVD